MYKASNVTFNPETLQAYSYDWWRFVDCINGKIVFNDYYYSSTTGKHQSKVRSLLQDLGIKIDLYVECPRGFQNDGRDESIINYYLEKIKELEDAINKPRSHKKTNERRKEEIEYYHDKIYQ
jgi:hypothetical protein